MKPETIDKIVWEANQRVAEWVMFWNPKQQRFELMSRECYAKLLSEMSMRSM